MKIRKQCDSHFAVHDYFKKEWFSKKSQGDMPMLKQHRRHIVGFTAGVFSKKLELRAG